MLSSRGEAIMILKDWMARDCALIADVGFVEGPFFLTMPCRLVSLDEANFILRLAGAAKGDAVYLDFKALNIGFTADNSAEASSPMRQTLLFILGEGKLALTLSEVNEDVPMFE